MKLVSSTKGSIWTNGKEWWLFVREVASPAPFQGFRCLVLVVTAQGCELFLAKLLCFSCWPKKKVCSYAHKELDFKFNQWEKSVATS